MMAMMIMLSSWAGRVFTVPGDKILPYFKGFRQDEYPTTFPPPPPPLAIYMEKYQIRNRN